MMETLRQIIFNLNVVIALNKMILWFKAEIGTKEGFSIQGLISIIVHGCVSKPFD